MLCKVLLHPYIFCIKWEHHMQLSGAWSRHPRQQPLGHAEHGRLCLDKILSDNVSESVKYFVEVTSCESISSGQIDCPCQISQSSLSITVAQSLARSPRKCICIWCRRFDSLSYQVHTEFSTHQKGFFGRLSYMQYFGHKKFSLYEEILRRLQYSPSSYPLSLSV